MGPFEKLSAKPGDVLTVALLDLGNRGWITKNYIMEPKLGTQFTLLIQGGRGGVLNPLTLN